jgi:hypothetical protein
VCILFWGTSVWEITLTVEETDLRFWGIYMISLLNMQKWFLVCRLSGCRDTEKTALSLKIYVCCRRKTALHFSYYKYMIYLYSECSVNPPFLPTANLKQGSLMFSRFTYISWLQNLYLYFSTQNLLVVMETSKFVGIFYSSKEMFYRFYRWPITTSTNGHHLLFAHLGTFFPVEEVLQQTC